MIHAPTKNAAASDELGSETFAVFSSLAASKLIPVDARHGVEIMKR
jgi:hypothetical protein